MKKGGVDVALILGKPGKGKPSEDEYDDDMEESEEDEGEDDKVSLADDVLSAIADKDSEALASALESFFAAC